MFLLDTNVISELVEPRPFIGVTSFLAALRPETLSTCTICVGRPIAFADAMIAATAFVNGAVLVTRNTSDFEDCGLDVRNPWLAS